MSSTLARTSASVSAAAASDDAARRTLGRAADCYGRAFGHYCDYLASVRAHRPEGQADLAALRTPEHVGELALFLEQGIAEEATGLEALEAVLDVLG